MDRVFVDTSAWYALTDRGDPDHRAVAAWLAQNRFALVTSNFVVDEILTLLLVRLGHRVAVRFAEKLRKSRLCTVVAVDGSDEEQAWERFRRASDKLWSFTDCTSFALMTRLGLMTAFAFDDHFRQAGLHVVPSSPGA